MFLNFVLNLVPRAWLNSLSRHVDAFEQEWQGHSRSNSLGRRGRLQHLMVWGTGHPLLFVVAIAASIGLLSFGVPWLLERLFGLHIFGLKSWARADFLTYMGSAYATQATIAALVYPLVVAFIGFLMQRRATSKVALTAYLLDTGVVPSGASSFALLFAMTLGYLALSFLSSEAPMEMAVASVLWLGVNLLLTAWFLYRTTRFLQDEHSAEVLAWLAASVTLPRDIRAHMAGLLMQNAQRSGWMPGRVFDGMSDGPSVILYPLNEGDVCVQASTKLKSEVVDVRFRLLAWAARLWLAEVNRSHTETRGTGAWPTLEFPARPGQEGETFVFARVRSGPKPSWLGRLLIRASFVLERQRKAAMPFSTDEVLAEIAHDVVSQIEARNYPRFNQVLTELRTLHIDLIHASVMLVEGGLPSSAALLESPYGFGSTTFSRDWMAQYRDINNAAAHALEVDGRYFSSVAYTTQLFGYAFADQAADILRDALLPARNLFFQLQQVWSEKNGDPPAEQLLKGVRLSAPFDKRYADAVSDWVSAWEGFHIPSSKDFKLTDIESWDFMRKKVLVLADHIDFTATAMVRAIVAGDAVGAGYFQDCLVKWWGNRVHELGTGHTQYRDENSVLTLSLADLEYDVARSVIPGLPDGLQTIGAMAQSLNYVLMRYWEDVRLVVCALLFSDGGFVSGIDSLATRMAMNVLSMHSQHDGGRLTGKRLDKSGQILSRSLRIEGSENVYSQRFEKLLERATENVFERVIAGRIYSWSGSRDLRSLQGELAAIAMVLYRPRQPFPDVERSVGLSTRSLDALGRMSRFANQVGEELEADKVADRIHTIEGLRKGLDLPGTVDEACEGIIKLCLHFADAATNHEKSLVSQTPISRDQLRTFERSCAEAIFRPGGKFPLRLTNQFEPTEAELLTAEQVFTGMSKLPFTEGPLEELRHSDVEMISQVLGERVLQEAVERLIQRDGVQRVRDDTPAAFYADLLSKMEDIVRRGLDPVIVSDRSDTIELLSPWRTEEAPPLPRNLSVLPSRSIDGDDAWSTVNGAPVYLVPMASKRVIVTSRQHIEKLQFKEMDGKVGLKLEAEPQDERRIKMSFTFAVRFAPLLADGL